MANYFYKKGSAKVYIKEIDFPNTKLTFTNKKDEAYEGRDGYYAGALREQITTLFRGQYPEVTTLDYEY